MKARIKKRAGITLLELTIGLAILAIVTGGVFASFRHYQRQTLHNASLMLQADLRYAQRRAMIEGQNVGIFFDRELNEYRLVDNIVGGLHDLIRTVHWPSGVTIYSTTPPQLNRVHFLPRGTISTAFTIQLANGRYRQNITATVGAGRIEIMEISIAS